MLEKLINIGEIHYNFELKRLKDIDKSCCKNIEDLFYDFDKIKEKIVEEHKFQTLSSCDVLNICLEDTNQSFDFIEMKGLLQFQENAKTEKDIDKQIAKFDFEKKIEDSLYLLQTILNSDNFKATKKEREEFCNFRKRYFIVTDISLEQNPLDLLVITMEHLSTTSNIDKYIEIKLLDKIEKTEFNTKIEKPKLINCSELKQYI